VNLEPYTEHITKPAEQYSSALCNNWQPSLKWGDNTVWLQKKADRDNSTTYSTKTTI